MVKFKVQPYNFFKTDSITKDKIKSILRMRIKSMSATSGPPIGPVLGQFGIPISKFCSEFNERSNVFNEGVYVFVTLYLFHDGHYSFDMSVTFSSLLFKRAANLDKGSGLPGIPPHKCKGVITPYLLFEAILYKAQQNDDLFGPHSVKACCLRGVGTLRSLGINRYQVV